MTDTIPSWATLKTMARNLGVSFEQSTTHVSVACPTTGAFGDFYPEGHDEEARRQAYTWMTKTLATIDAMREAAEQARANARGVSPDRRRRARG